MVSPALSERPPVASSSAGIKEMYFSPNRVLGTIWAVTSAGTLSMSSGFMPSVKLISSPTTFTSRTSPTIIPRSLMSAFSGRFRPAFTPVSVTLS
jgi:hypothetical protein